jgi:hypothetical protein
VSADCLEIVDNGNASSLRRRAARSGSNIIDSPSARNGSSTRSTSRQRGSRTYGSDDEKADTHSMVTALTADHHRVERAERGHDPLPDSDRPGQPGRRAPGEPAWRADRCDR